jgi:hypothetical protein
MEPKVHYRVHKSQPLVAPISDSVEQSPSWEANSQSTD